MNDLISRKVAIGAIVDELKKSPTSAIRAKTRLECLPSAQKWIPVSERLPEEEDEYLVTIKGSIDTWTSSHDFDGEEFGFYAHKDDELIWCPVKNVVAWQPLPEPYKGGNHG